MRKRQAIIRLCLCFILVVILCLIIVKAVAGLLFPADDTGPEAATPTEGLGVTDPSEEEPHKPSKVYIVLDPGHGGEGSPGCVYDDILERDVTLELSLMLRDELIHQGYEVLMTREEDKTVTLKQRAQIANESGADLFISIHLNSHKDTSVSGIETWFNPDANNRNSELAEYVQQSVAALAEARDRGTYSNKSLILTREVQIPSCLVEVGYLSNVEEREKMTTDAYRRKIIKGITEGVRQYLEELR